MLVRTPVGGQVPIDQLASMTYRKGPMVVRSEATRPNAWIYVDITGIDVGTYVKEAMRVVAAKVKLPPGYNIAWSGQYEYMERARKRLMVVIPLTIFIIFARC